MLYKLPFNVPVIMDYHELYEREHRSVCQIPASVLYGGALQPQLDGSGTNDAVPLVAALSPLTMANCTRVPSHQGATR